GSHGRLPSDPADAPVLLCSDPSAARDRVAATEVKALLLELAGLANGDGGRTGVGS
ncbi:alkaline phosphatase family protein, partial [Micromonospora sp. NPDC049580]